MTDRGPAAGLDYERLFDTLPVSLLVLNLDLEIVHANITYLGMVMRTPDELQGKYVFDAFPETDTRVKKIKSGFDLALKGETNTVASQPFDIPIPESQGGGFQKAHWTCTQTPLTDEAGEICAICVHVDNVTAKHEVDAHNALLRGELSHRVKNMLATIQAIARLSFTDDVSVIEGRTAFLGRLKALSISHDILADDDLPGAMVSAVVTRSLKPFGGRNSKRFSTAGEPAYLDAKAATSLALAINELGTNALKYGALSTDQGDVSISWEKVDIESGRALHFEWRESGGPAVAPPTRKGFGTVLLESVLAMDLMGSSKIDYPKEGVFFQCTFPL